MTLFPVKVAPRAIRRRQKRHLTTMRWNQLELPVKQSEVMEILHNYDINIKHPKENCHIYHHQLSPAAEVIHCSGIKHIICEFSLT